MARSCKQGLEYFPLDVYPDRKLKMVQVKHGLEGFAMVIKLYQAIYSEGYWMKCDQDQIDLLADENNIEPETLQAIIDTCIFREIFDKEIFEKHQVLTSRGIQKRYKDIVKRRKGVEETPQYTLIDDIAPTQCAHNDDINQQSKVKESKVKEKKVNKDHLAGFSDDFLDTLEEFKKYRKQIKAPMEEQAEKMLITKLKKLANNETEQIAIMQESMTQGWKGVFPLDKKKDPKPETSGKYDYDAIARRSREKLHENSA